MGAPGPKSFGFAQLCQPLVCRSVVVQASLAQQRAECASAPNEDLGVLGCRRKLTEFLR